MKTTEQPKNPARELREKQQAEAGYRVALKRIIRSAVGWVDNETPTANLETQVKALAKTAPAVVARGIEAWFEQSAKAWERGNNSGINAIREQEEENCERLRNRAEHILALWGVECDYPGLYPSFKLGDFTYYDCLSLLRAISTTK